MNFSEFSIKRPVFTWVCAFLIVLVGILAIFQLPLREYPKFERASLNISTSYPGANPKLVEKKVTIPIEKALSEISGIDAITSYSLASTSVIDVDLKTAVDTREILQQIRSKLGEVEAKLPQEAKRPIIQQEKEGKSPAIVLSIESNKNSHQELYYYAHKSVAPIFKQIPGVSTVKIQGTPKQVKILIDPMKMLSYRLSIDDLVKTIQSHQDMPAGTQVYGSNKFSNIIKGSANSVEDLENLVLLQYDAYSVRLKDIAQIQVEKDPSFIPARLNGEIATCLNIHKEELANPISVSKEVVKQVKALQKRLPPDIKLKVIYDQSIYIKESLRELRSTVLEAAVLVIFIISLFLRSFRASTVALITIPISLLGALFLLYFMGYTLNTMTLLAFVLAIGMVVDDAIVVLENVYRYLEKGYSPFDAAVKGTSEITFAIISMTLTLACVFFPLLFIKGLVGQLFSEFAFALTFSIVVSGYVALSTSPMICAYFLKKKDLARVETSEGRYQRVFSYVLRYVLKARYLFMALALLLVFPSYWLYQELPKELAPQEDRGLLRLSCYTPGYPTLSEMNKSTLFLEDIAKNMSEKQLYFANIYKSFAQVTVLLDPWQQRTQGAHDKGKLLESALNDYPASWTFWEAPSGLLAGDDPRFIQFALKTNYDIEALKHMVQLTKSAVKDNPGLENPIAFLKKDAPENHFVINYENLDRYHISPQSLSRQIQALFQGQTGLTLNTGLKDFRIRILLDKSPESIENLLSQSSLMGTIGGKQVPVPLSELVTFKKNFSQEEYCHYNGSLATFFRVQLKDSYSLDEGVAFLENLAKTQFPPFSEIEFSGSVKKFNETNEELMYILLFACLVIYLVLAAQFESFIDPLVILLTVPLAIFGSLLSLKLFGGTLNFYSQIGIITLIGIITKHGILIVDFANDQIKQGASSLQQAVCNACSQRLRPILMTTLSTVFGAVPLVISNNAGKELRFEIGCALIGGLVFGTILTLFIIPCFYCLFARFKKA